jgi:hypothetical protein
MAKQIKDAGNLNSPSAIQVPEDAEMRSAMVTIQVGAVVDQSSSSAR